MRSNLARLSGLFLALLAAPCALTAQRPSAIPLIPAANWRLAETKKLNLNAVRQWGGDSAIEREYGVQTIEARTYILKNQRAEVVIEETPDASSAYGLLTYYQTEQSVPVARMPLTLKDSSGVSMCRGRYFVRIPRADKLDVTDSEFQALLVLIGGVQTASPRSPHLPMGLPEKNLVPGSEKYLLGPEAAQRVLPGFRTDLIGFTQGAEVQVGTYRSGEERITLLAIAYPTPQIARVRYGAMESFLGFNQERGSESIYARRTGSYVFVVLGSPSADQADKLMGQLHVTGQISWDQRPPRSKPFAREFLELILANLLLILILVGGSVGGGVLMFAAKRMVAKWFPEWAWANPDEDKLIRLNLN
ncbi:MAG TPA: DUF6599 family protein [Terriglobia bacterium]|nr:DUF6599 family protein [Terriglobia bacterium]